MDFDEERDYLDLDNILAHTQTVNCKFLLSIPGLEFLSRGSSESIRPNTEIALPFWLAKTLYVYSRIDIELPHSYSKEFSEILEADPDVVDLHKAGPHYYLFGKLLLNLKREKGNNLPVFTQAGQRNIFRREEGDTLTNRRSIAESLIDTFHRRRHKLIIFSLSHPGGEGDRSREEVRKYVSRLDNLEKRLFKIGSDQAKQLNDWTTRKIELISNNNLTATIAKRRKRQE